MKTPVMLGIVLLVGAGCGGGGDGGGGGATTSTASCTVHQASGAGCVEWEVTQEGQISGFSSSCTSQGGTFARASCPSANRVGRCAMSQGGQAFTLVFYAPSTVANGQTACSAASGVWTSG
jgi:hypothetical protein